MCQRIISIRVCGIANARWIQCSLRENLSRDWVAGAHILCRRKGPVVHGVQEGREFCRHEGEDSQGTNGEGTSNMKVWNKADSW